MRGAWGIWQDVVKFVPLEPLLMEQRYSFFPGALLSKHSDPWDLGASQPKVWWWVEKPGDTLTLSIPFYC